MDYRSVKLPADFVAEVERCAHEEYRSVSQQLLYWAHLGEQLAKSYFTDNDMELGKIAVERYRREKHLAVKVNLDDL